MKKLWFILPFAWLWLVSYLASFIPWSHVEAEMRWWELPTGLTIIASFVGAIIFAISKVEL